MGRFYDFENWGLVQALRRGIEEGFLQLYCLDSWDAQSLYAFHLPASERLARHEAFEQYVLYEVIPLAQRINPAPTVITCGCSLGAFHAINFAVRHARLVKKAVGLSGRYDVTRAIEWFPALLEGLDDTLATAHTPYRYVRQLPPGEYLEGLQRMEIILAVGREDPFLESNQQLSLALEQRGVFHQLHYWDGRAHKAVYWRNMLPWYL